MSPFKKHFISCYLLVSIFIGVIHTANAQKLQTSTSFLKKYKKEMVGSWQVDSIFASLKSYPTPFNKFYFTNCIISSDKDVFKIKFHINYYGADTLGTQSIYWEGKIRCEHDTLFYYLNSIKYEWSDSSADERIGNYIRLNKNWLMIFNRYGWWNGGYETFCQITIDNATYTKGYSFPLITEYTKDNEKWYSMLICIERNVLPIQFYPTDDTELGYRKGDYFIWVSKKIIQ